MLLRGADGADVARPVGKGRKVEVRDLIVRHTRWQREFAADARVERPCHRVIVDAGTLRIERRLEGWRHALELVRNRRLQPGRQIVGVIDLDRCACVGRGERVDPGRLIDRILPGYGRRRDAGELDPRGDSAGSTRRHQVNAEIKYIRRTVRYRYGVC